MYSGDISRTVWPCETNRRPRKCAPQHASITTTHAGSPATNLTTPSRVTRRRTTTAPVASSPARLQLCLPRSMPSTAIAVLPMVVSSVPEATLRRVVRGGPSHKVAARGRAGPLRPGRRTRGLARRPATVEARAPGLSRRNLGLHQHGPALRP